jgi:predicted nucleic acid-binding protein
VSVFIDTSALFAVLDAGDRNHREADSLWQALLAGDEPLVTTSYVVVESIALLQSRLGLGAVNDFERGLFPILQVDWVGEEDHRAGVAALLAAGRRRLSIVDCVSFIRMKRRGIKRCFAFDPDFEAHGFEPLR